MRFVEPHFKLNGRQKKQIIQPVREAWILNLNIPDYKMSAEDMLDP